MTEQAKPLGVTGSITPGRSVAAMFELVARPDELVVSDQLRDAWGAVNHLYTHFDGRMDLDHPESKPEGADDFVNWGSWFEYLRNPDVEMPDDGSLTEVQQQAFASMREQFDILGTTSEQRDEFTLNLWMIGSASWQAKRAKRIGGHGGFAYWRQREATHVAHLFATVVPVEDYGPRFMKFVHSAESMGRAFKLADTINDMDRDMDNHNIDIEPSPLRYIRLFGRAAMHGVKVLAHNPRATVPFVQKALAARKNRSGKLNEQRTNI